MTRSTRHLRPHIDTGPWGGGALTDDGSPIGDSVEGGCLCIQWLGMMIEIGVGRVKGGRK